MFDEIFNFLNKDNSEFDWEKAKQTGKVEEFTEVKNGIRTITKKYTDHQGNKFSYVSSSYIGFEHDSKKEEINSIEKEIQSAIKLEDYELAASLAKRKKELLNKN